MKVNRFELKWVGPIHNGFARVKRRDGMWNFIDKDDELLCKDKWFRYVFDFEDGFAVIQNEYGMENFIRQDGKLLLKKWHESAERFKDGFGRVFVDGKCHMVNAHGKVF